MIEFLFGAPDALPRGACLAWRPALVWTRAGADIVSMFSCLALAVAAAVFIARRHDLATPARRLGFLLIAFLVAVSLTNLGFLVTLWVPAYGAQGMIKLATAAIALSAAVLVWPQIPKLLALPSPNDLEHANQRLARNNDSLERTVAERTHELEQSNMRFEAALTGTNITVSSQDRDLRYTWIHNPPAGLSADTMIGRTADEIGPSASSDAAAIKRASLASGKPAHGLVTVTSGSNGVRYVDLSVMPTRDRAGAIDGLLCTEVDVTEKRMTEVRLAALASQVASAYRRFELALDNSAITVFEQDTDLRYTFMYNPPPDTLADEFLGKDDAEVFSAADAARLISVKRKLLATGESQHLEIEVMMAGQPRFYDLRLDPDSDGDEAPRGIVGTAVDLTERRRNEKHMRLVMRELTHRSKNLLAVIQSMARKTASTASDTESFITDFSARLRAIAAAHDLLVAESWSGADIRDLLVASLAQTVDPAAPEIRIDGPAVRLSPDSAQTLALAFHELTNNAIQHGALSAPGGRIEIVWARDGDVVNLTWRESGGRPVQRSDRRGFGRVLLERLVGASLGGSAELEFRPEGVSWQIRFPEHRAS